ncbi:septum formation family protein [Demetria terragena]|uniref:septum formation family protein n=1 Tax=Demetria terragena TaxID=63959 RepID=UPI000367A1C1|nr:septum formation family protein [Demetria terragena]
MKRASLVAATSAGLLTVALSACGQDKGPTVTLPSTPASGSQTPTETSAPTTESPSTSSSSSSSTTTEPAKPIAAGDCLGPAPSYTRVKCNEAHTFEVFFVKDDKTSADNLVKRGAWVKATCNTEGAKFLGNTGFFVSRVDVDPAPATVNPDSSSRIACMAKEFRTSLRGLVSSATSLKGALKGDKYNKYQLCSKGKASDTDLKLVSCLEPHAGESVGGKINGKPGDPFPKGGDNKIHADARKYCQPLAKKYLGATRSDITFAENSGGPGPWARGDMVSGCFVETKDGSTVTKSLKGIGKKPLKSYK